MRVDNQDVNGVAGSSSFSRVAPAGANSNSSSSKAGDNDSSSDVVKLSNASSLVQLARQIASADRQSRINQLASEVRSGSYQVNLQDVSQALVEQSR